MNFFLVYAVDKYMLYFNSLIITEMTKNEE